MIQLECVTCLSTASDQLKHQIKTLLSLPPSPQHTHTYKSRQGPKRQSKGHCHGSMVSGRLCPFRASFPLQGWEKPGFPWSCSMKDPRQGRKPACLSQEMLRPGGLAHKQRGTHSPPACPYTSHPCICFSSLWLPCSLSLSLFLSLCLCLCAFMCAPKARFRMAGPAGGNGGCSPHSLRLTGIRS